MNCNLMKSEDIATSNNTSHGCDFNFTRAFMIRFLDKIKEHF